MRKKELFLCRVRSILLKLVAGFKYCGILLTSNEGNMYILKYTLAQPSSGSHMRPEADSLLPTSEVLCLPQSSTGLTLFCYKAQKLLNCSRTFLLGLLDSAPAPWPPPNFLQLHPTPPQTTPLSTTLSPLLTRFPLIASLFVSLVFLYLALQRRLCMISPFYYFLHKI